MPAVNNGWEVPPKKEGLFHPRSNGTGMPPAPQELGACQGAGVKRFLYVSNMGAGPDQTYPFLRSKWRGEEAVRASGIPFIIFRSSIMYGPEDEFTRNLAPKGLLSHM